MHSRYMQEALAPIHPPSVHPSVQPDMRTKMLQYSIHALCMQVHYVLTQLHHRADRKTDRPSDTRQADTGRQGDKKRKDRDIDTQRQTRRQAADRQICWIQGYLIPSIYLEGMKLFAYTVGFSTWTTFR